MNKKKGFTLIELLMSIVVISLILGAVMVSVLSLINTSKVKSYTLFEKNILEAANIYGKEYSLEIDYTDNAELGFRTACLPIQVLIDKGITKRTNLVDNYIKEGNESVFLIINSNGILSANILKGKCEDNQDINPVVDFNSDLVTANKVSKDYGENEDDLLKYVKITDTGGRSGRIYILLNNSATPYMSVSYDSSGTFEQKVNGDTITKNLNNVKVNKIIYKLVPDATNKVVSKTLDYEVLSSVPTLELTSDSLSFITGANVNLLDGVVYDDRLVYNNRPLNLKVEINGKESTKTSGTTTDLGLAIDNNTVTYTVSNIFEKTNTKTRTYTIRTATVVQYSTANEEEYSTPSCGSCACGAHGEVVCVGCAVCPWDGVSYDTDTRCGTYSDWSTNKGSGSCCRKRTCSMDSNGNVYNCSNYTSC